MPKESASKTNKGKVRDLRNVPPPPPLPTKRARLLRGNHALPVVPLHTTPPAPKRPNPDPGAGPSKKKTKGAQDAAPADSHDLYQQSPEQLRSSQRTSHRVQNVSSPDASSPPSDPSSSSDPFYSSTASTRNNSSSHPSSSYVSTLSSPALIAATIERIRAANQGRTVQNDNPQSADDTSGKKAQTRHTLPEPAAEDETSEEEEVEEGCDDLIEEDAEEDSENAVDDTEEVSPTDARRFIKAICKSKKSKFHVTDADPKQLTEHFKTWGRHCNRLCGLYTDIHKTIVIGMTVLRADPRVEEEYESCYKAIPNMSAAMAKLYTNNFFHLCDEVSKFMALCEQIISSPEDVFIFAKYMQVHAAAGHTTDISTLKTSLHSYFPYVVVSQTRVIPPPGPRVLAGHKNRNGGYCTTGTGRLIVPIDERSAFDQDPTEYYIVVPAFMLMPIPPYRYCKKKIGQIKQVANRTVRHKKRHQADRPEHRDDNKSYPSYLFLTDLKYDPACPQHHIFKSDFLVAGPSAVGRQNGSRGLGRKTIIDIYSITKVTPDYLTYVASLIRYLLSNEDRWNGDDAQRTGHRFHTALHSHLTVEFQAWEEDVDNDDFEQSDEPLDWNVFAYFNDKVFGSEAGAPDQQNPDEFIEDLGDDQDDIRTQALKARMAELDARCQRRRLGIRDASPQRTEQRQPRSQSPEVVETTSEVVDVTEYLEDSEPPSDDAGGWSLPC
ncbi:hypothetical protein BD309DRAFT_877825 [Dichomitus squalens]|uniref:Uncharacterized protein n=1 Tax=Dichomitus squalens TaxID=114155 RepID=A0A4Q9PFR0_9APHY|nr:hypothetical protein BD309DRAFT_877825 [Dichomitus squalens]TBU51156.1 hypothetical protein BD310DRAFT_835120 [Dichomitus squalens]